MTVLTISSVSRQGAALAGLFYHQLVQLVELSLLRLLQPHCDLPVAGVGGSAQQDVGHVYHGAAQRPTKALVGGGRRRTLGGVGGYHSTDAKDVQDKVELWTVLDVAQVL